MATETFLRIPNTCHDPKNDDEPNLPLRTTRSSADLSQWTFACTDGDAAFVLRLDGSSLSNARGKAFKGSDDAWLALLRWIFFRDTSTDLNLSHAFDLTAEDVSSQQLTIVLRETLLGPKPIVQRLGSFTLRRDQAATNLTSLVEWTATCAEQGANTHRESLRWKREFERVSADNERLRQALQDLTAAKAESEQLLLEKCRRLLNSKKLKIRDQQRLLAGAKVDADAAAQVGSARARARGQAAELGAEPGRDENGKGHRALPSRSSKRRMPSPPPEPPAEEDDARDQGEETTDGDEEGVTDDDADADDLRRTPDSRRESSDAEAAEEPATRSSRPNAEANDEMAVDQEEIPTRELPFPKERQKDSQRSQQVEEMEDAATEDDDEL